MLLDQPQHADRDDKFGDGGDADRIVGRDGAVGGDVGQTGGADRRLAMAIKGDADGGDGCAAAWAAARRRAIIVAVYLVSRRGKAASSVGALPAGRARLVENAFCRVKDVRLVATPYDKLAANFLSAVALATAVAYWL